MPTVTYESIVRSLPGLVSYWPLGEAEPTEVVNYCPNPKGGSGLTGWGSNHGVNTVVATGIEFECTVESLSAGPYFGSNKDFAVSPGETISALFAVKEMTVGSAFLAQIEWYTVAGARLSVVKGVTISAPGSAKVTAVAPAEAAYIIVNLYSSTTLKVGDFVVHGGLRISRGTEATGYVDGDISGNLWSGKAGQSTTLKAPVAKDSFGTNNGEYTGGITLGEAGLLIGDTATAAKFDGSTGYVKVPHTASLSPANALTLGALVDPTASGTQKLIGGNVNTVNHIANPNFEHDTVGSAPAKWTSAMGLNVALEDFKVSEAWASKGAKSLHVKAVHPAADTTSRNISAQASVGVPDSIPVVPGQTVKISCALKIVTALAEGFRWEFIWYKADQVTKISNVASAIQLGGRTGVQTLAASAVAPAEATYCVLRFQGWTNIERAVYEFYIDEIIDAEIYVDGDTPGCFWSGKAGESTTVLPYYALELVSQKLKVMLPIGTHGELTTLESPGTVELARGTLVVATFIGKSSPLLGHIYLYVDGAQVATRTVIGLLAETPEYLLLGNGLIGKQQYPFIGSQAISPAWVAYMHEIAVKGPLPVGARKTGFPDPVHKTGMIEVVY